MSTDIVVVLDRSGSMEMCKADTIGGFNAFLEAQKNVPGECTISLYQFDYEYNAVYEGVPINEAPLLTPETFKPRGMTALLDAVGLTINSVGARLAALPESERPEKVLVVIQTDGHENASTEFKISQIKEMIEHQKSKYSWEFVFLGAGEDAIAVGASMGVSAASTLAYNARNLQGTMKSVSNYTTGYRVSGTTEFTDEDREGAK